MADVWRAVGATGTLQDNISNVYSVGIWYNANKGLLREQIINQESNRGWTSLNSQPGGSAIRYIKDPLSDGIIDMRYMLIVGKWGFNIGNYIEEFQYAAGKKSGRNVQDYYSNMLGSAYYNLSYGQMGRACPTCFSSSVKLFLKDPNYCYIRSFFGQ